MATVFRVGDMPRKFDGATVIEHTAAYAIRVKAHVIVFESRKVRNISGSAQRSLRVTFVFDANDSCSVGQELPLAATGLLDMFTIYRRFEGHSMAFHTDCVESFTLNHPSCVKIAWHVTDPKNSRQGCPGNFPFWQRPMTLLAHVQLATVVLFIETMYAENEPME